jgi:cell division septum initiation protein DivIVA
MDDRRIHSSNRLTSAELARANFSVLRKGGFDPNEVRIHLEAAAREMAHLENRVRELHEQLAEARRQALNPVLDEATLASALGAQSAAILRSAHEEAGRVTAEAQERAALLFGESQQRGAGYLVESQERAAALVTEAENTASQIDHDARLAAERLIESAKVNGEALIERAREQGRAIVEQATDARRAVLNDLAVRRKALHMQIEQLRAARDSLGSFVTSIRQQVDDVMAGVATSDEVARVAAAEALRQQTSGPEPTEEELLAGTPLRQVPDVVTPPLEAPVLEAPSRARPAPGLRAAPATDEIARTRRRARPEATSDEPHPGDEPSGTDVVNEIFARLRKATLEERGATAPVPKRAPSKRAETPNDELFGRRDAALAEALGVLTRRVKRALQDDQNIALDRLRDVTGMITTELEDERVQRSRYADAAYEALDQAAAAGVGFARSLGAPHDVPVDREALDECAEDLAVTIVFALRKRILSDVAGDGTERANAAYREWRGARVERLCVDATRRAFHLGVVSAVEGTAIRFVVAPGDPPCDACARDASVGDHRAGAKFPSGSLYPPLHAGCACAIVPA